MSRAVPQANGTGKEALAAPLHRSGDHRPDRKERTVAASADSPQRRDKMLRKLLFGAGAAYMARKFMGGRSSSSREYSRGGFGMAASRMGRLMGIFGF